MTWLTRAEAAARIGGHTSKLRRWISMGELASVDGWIALTADDDDPWSSARRRWVDDRPETASDNELRARRTPLVDEDELLAVDGRMRSRHGGGKIRGRRKLLAATHSETGESLDEFDEPSTGFLPPTEIRERLSLVSKAIEFLVDTSSTVMREAPSELEQLRDALETRRPECVNDPRFTVDISTLTNEDVEQMGAKCAQCPVRTACRAYAIAADPPIGFWAGSGYPSLEAVA